MVAPGPVSIQPDLRRARRCILQATRDEREVFPGVFSRTASPFPSEQPLVALSSFSGKESDLHAFPHWNHNRTLFGPRDNVERGPYDAASIPLLSRTPAARQAHAGHRSMYRERSSGSTTSVSLRCHVDHDVGIVQPESAAWCLQVQDSAGRPCRTNKGTS